MPRRKPLPDIGSACRAHAGTMLKVLCTIATREDSPESARIQAASKILAYGYGNPTSKIEAKGLGNQTLIINGDTRDIARRLIHAMAGETLELSGGSVVEGKATTIDPDNSTISSS